MRKLQRQILTPYQVETKSGHRVTCYLCTDCGLHLVETNQAIPLSGPAQPDDHPGTCDAEPCNGRPTHLKPWYITLRKEHHYG